MVTHTNSNCKLIGDQNSKSTRKHGLYMIRYAMWISLPMPEKYVATFNILKIIL